MTTAMERSSGQAAPELPAALRSIARAEGRAEGSCRERCRMADVEPAPQRRCNPRPAVQRTDTRWMPR